MNDLVSQSGEGSYREGLGYALWCLAFVGLAGIHRIYLGRYGTGILYLLTFGLFGIGQFIDLFRMKSLVQEANIREAALQIYEVDLLKLYLREKNLADIAKIDLAGIDPAAEVIVPLGDGADFADMNKTVKLKLKEEGAFLVICRGDDLFTSGLVLVSPLKLEIQEEAAGSAFWHRKGWTLYRTVESYMRRRLEAAGYIEVKTPQLVDRSLWEASGHWEKFQENMYIAETPDDRVFCCKPMNCPGHVQIYKNGLKSYRDLPLRIAEFGKVHRYEPSGALHGYGVLDNRFRYRFDQRRCNETRGHHVSADPAVCYFLGQRSRRADQSGFCGGVVYLTAVTVQGRYR